MLYIRTCHEMYLSGDGKHHQANMTIALYIPDMAVTDLHCLVSASGAGYVSHSFNQFIVADGSDMVFADHGDAYPRSVVLHLSEGAAGKRTLPQLRLPEVDSLPIAENTGHYNGTGVNVGGMLCSDTHYIVVGKTCDQSGGIDQDKAQKNIFVAVTPKDSFTDEATVRHFLMDYAADANVAVSAPHLVQLERNRFLILWTAEGKLHYCILDGQGQRTSQVFTCEGALSDCVPILSDGRVIWYVTENSAPVFYAIELNYIADAPHKHQLRTTMVTQPDTQPGLVRLTCTGCELVEELTLPALDSQEYRVDIETAPGCTESGEARYTWPTPHSIDISFTAPLPPTGHLYRDGACAHCGEEEPTFTLGDVNGDGKINVTDAMVTLRYAVKKISADDLILEAADVTGDGKVNVTDAMQILRYAVKKITEFK
jgi:hypothetical protein